MKMQDFLCSYELSCELLQLGVRHKTQFYYLPDKRAKPTIKWLGEGVTMTMIDLKQVIPAPTSAEIFSILTPDKIDLLEGYIVFNGENWFFLNFEFTSEVEVRSFALAWMLKSGDITL